MAVVGYRTARRSLISLAFDFTLCKALTMMDFGFEKCFGMLGAPAFDARPLFSENLVIK